MRLKKELYDVWESYCFVAFYGQYLHSGIKDFSLSTLELNGIATAAPKKYSRNFTFGALSHLEAIANPKRTLLDAVSYFEYFLNDLCEFVYSDFPGKLAGSQAKDSPDREVKVIDVVLSSATRDEIIDKLIEEKIRGILYGKPTDFFTTAKAPLEFKDFFKSNASKSLRSIGEVFARRNAYAHNGGLVDRKYIRKVDRSNFAVGDRTPLSSEYLRLCIGLLLGFAAISATLVVERIYNEKTQGKLERACRRFRTQCLDEVPSSRSVNLDFWLLADLAE